MKTLDLDTLTLRSGMHEDPDQGMCLLEAVSYFAGEEWSDAPACVDHTLAAFGRSWNDGMRTDAERDQLKPYVPVLVGTAGTGEDAARRAWLALDWSVRVSAPAWLDLAGLADQADRLRSLPEQTVPDADVTALLRDARRDAQAAWAAARGAAWAAAREAAWAAAREAAGAAAGEAAREAAREAAGAAAGAAAWAAAREAAGAAAREAARDALEPTVTGLQQSAHLLYRTMIAAGPHDAAALAAMPEVSR